MNLKEFKFKHTFINYTNYFIFNTSFSFSFSVNNLQDLWFKINEGIPFGNSSITPSSLAKFLIIFFIGYYFTKLLQKIINERVLPATRLDAGGKGITFRIRMVLVFL